MTRRNWMTIGLMLAMLFWPSSGLADNYNWTGASDGDFEVVGNWTTNGVVAESAPSTDDDVVFNTHAIAVTANVDQSDMDFDSVLIGEGYTGILGNSKTDPLKFGADKLVVNGGGSTLHLGTGGTYAWDEALIVACGPNGTDDLYLSGTITLLHVQKGDIEYTTGTITTLYIDGLTRASTLVDFDITGGTVTTMYAITGDIVQLDGTVTTAYMDAGSYTITDGTLTNLVLRSGTTYWNTSTTLATAILYGGTLDCSGSIEARTISSLTLFGASTANIFNGASNITITGGAKMYQGTLTPSTGQVLTPS